MRSRKLVAAFGVGLVLLTTILFVAFRTKQPAPAPSFSQQDDVIAGSAQDSLEVRHLVLKGSNEDIGHALARIAQERFQVRPLPSQDALRTRAQRQYIEKSFPILHERMRGVASSFGHRLEDDGTRPAVLLISTSTWAFECPWRM